MAYSLLACRVPRGEGAEYDNAVPDGAHGYRQRLRQSGGGARPRKKARPGPVIARRGHYWARSKSEA